MQTPSNSDSLAAETPVAPRRPRRLLKAILIAVAALVLLVLLLPFALSGVLRSQVQSTVHSNLRGDVSIGDVSFSWFSGLSASDLRIDNPPGFASERPAVVMKQMNADISLVSLLFGTPSASAEIVGLELNVEQDADGNTNLQQLLPEQEEGESPTETGEPGEPGEPGERPRQPRPSGDPDPIAFDFQLRDCAVTIRREGEVLEALTDFQCRAKKSANQVDIVVDASGKLRAGDLDVDIVLDPYAETADTRLATHGLDLANWRPLVDSFLPDQIVALAGKVDGELTAKLRSNERIELGGELVVDAPRLAGPIVQDMDLRAAKWSIRPALQLVDGQQQVDASGFAIDLEWLHVNGKPSGEAGQVALAYDLDVARLAEFGGPMPEMLRGSGSQLVGELRVPTAELPSDAAGWAKALIANANLDVGELDLGGFQLRQVGISATMRDGKVAIATSESTLLDDGQLIAKVDVDLADFDRMPTRAALTWNAGKLTGGATRALRYVVPMFAGLDAEVAQLVGSVDVEVGLDGPALKADDEEWLAWLDRWSGSGSVGLSDTAFAPASQLVGLLQPLGVLGKDLPVSKDGRLILDSFRAPFSFSNGTVRAESSEWLAGGEKVGVQGTATLSGDVLYSLDFASMLKGHRDGERVLQALGGELPPANIGGTLDAPTLGLPDLGDVTQKLLENQGKDLLKQGLDGLFGRKKKQ